MSNAKIQVVVDRRRNIVGAAPAREWKTDPTLFRAQSRGSAQHRARTRGTGVPYWRYREAE